MLTVSVITAVDASVVIAAEQEVVAVVTTVEQDVAAGVLAADQEVNAVVTTVEKEVAAVEITAVVVEGVVRVEID